MPRTEETTVTYVIEATGGQAEAEVIVQGVYTHEPWSYNLVRRTKTRVRDGRGTNWRESGHTDEVVAVVSAEVVGELIKTGAEALTWAPDTWNRNLAKVTATEDEVRCTTCGTRVELSDPTDEESWVHAEDGDWGDHTATVTKEKSA